MATTARKKTTTRRSSGGTKAAAPATVLEAIAIAAVDPQCDAEKIKALGDIHRTQSDTEAETAFNAAFAELQKKLPAIAREADNDQTKSKYARLDSINAAITPVITEHGFGTAFSEGGEAAEGHREIVCAVMHEAGWTRTFSCVIPDDAAGIKGNRNKTNTHAFGSTMTYGRRYLKTMIFDLTIGGEDDDGQAAGQQPRGANRSSGGKAPDMVSEGTLKTIETLLKQLGANDEWRAKFREWLGVGSLLELTEEGGQRAIRQLTSKLKRRQDEDVERDHSQQQSQSVQERISDAEYEREPGEEG